MHFDKFQFVDLFLDLNSIETVVLMTRKQTSGTDHEKTARQGVYHTRRIRQDHGKIPRKILPGHREDYALNDLLFHAFRVIYTTVSPQGCNNEA